MVTYTTLNEVVYTKNIFILTMSGRIIENSKIKSYLKLKRIRILLLKFFLSNKSLRARSRLINKRIKSSKINSSLI